MNKDFARGMIVSMALKSLPVRKKSPIAYLYNGVRLPALPEWDREAYPYAFIAHTAKQYIYFFVLDEPTYHNGTDGVWYITAVSHSVTDYKNPSEWSPMSGNTIDRACINLMWSNFDMLKSNGSIALAASDPIPIYNEPVNYLYNGVKLPKLPEWDKEAYPYAVITRNLLSNSIYNLWLLSSTETTENSSGEGQLRHHAGNPYSQITITNDTSAWSAWNTRDGDGVITLSKTLNALIWANFDVLDLDDAVFLAASEPIPINEKANPAKAGR